MHGAIICSSDVDPVVDFFQVVLLSIALFSSHGAAILRPLLCYEYMLDDLLYKLYLTRVPGVKLSALL